MAGGNQLWFILRVIESCKTLEQLNTAREWAEDRMWGSFDTSGLKCVIETCRLIERRLDPDVVESFDYTGESSFGFIKV